MASSDACRNEFLLFSTEATMLEQFWKLCSRRDGSIQAGLKRKAKADSAGLGCQDKILWNVLRHCTTNMMSKEAPAGTC
eukprot:CAMPEP_0197479556 /NCGR_PEP_ID=MMETSP1309-20131121/34910_1 /TAXON_ID=464262 /ORGANISM="Genus nov. species nov., Strain RCC998" /LENGTH=78 /DNA_ID=CAMNT_0043021259 /DNA_START=39 /DNA_END=272 /DNA_ORIENTATION=-